MLPYLWGLGKLTKNVCTIKYLALKSENRAMEPLSIFCINFQFSLCLEIHQLLKRLEVVHILRFVTILTLASGKTQENGMKLLTGQISAQKGFEDAKRISSFAVTSKLRRIVVNKRISNLQIARYAESGQAREERYNTFH